MTTSVSKNQISTHRFALVELLSELRFGRIDALVIRDGEPILDPPTVVLRTAKFGAGGEPAPRPQPGTPGTLPRHFTELFAFFDGLQNACAVEIVVQEGLPIRAIANVTGTIGQRRAPESPAVPQ